MFTHTDATTQHTSHVYSGLKYMTPSDREVALRIHSVNFYLEKTFDGDNGPSYREINSYGDLHLIPSSMPFIIPPPVRLLTVDVPGSVNGSVDMTESLTGSPLYGVREGTIDFMYENSYRHASPRHSGSTGPYVLDSNMNVAENISRYTWSNTDPNLIKPGESNYTRPDTGNRYFWKDGYQTPFDIYRHMMNYIHGKQVRIVLMDEPDYYYEGRVWVETMTPGQDSAGEVSIKYRLNPYRYKVLKSSENDGMIISDDGICVFYPRSNYPGYVRIENEMSNNKPVKAL